MKSRGLWPHQIINQIPEGTGSCFRLRNCLLTVCRMRQNIRKRTQTEMGPASRNDMLTHLRPYKGLMRPESVSSYDTSYSLHPARNQPKSHGKPTCGQKLGVQPPLTQRAPERGVALSPSRARADKGLGSPI